MTRTLSPSNREVVQSNLVVNFSSLGELFNKHVDRIPALVKLPDCEGSIMNHVHLSLGVKNINRGCLPNELINKGVCPIDAYTLIEELENEAHRIISTNVPEMNRCIIRPYKKWRMVISPLVKTEERTWVLK